MVERCQRCHLATQHECVASFSLAWRVATSTRPCKSGRWRDFYRALYLCRRWEPSQRASPNAAYAWGIAVAQLASEW